MTNSNNSVIFVKTVIIGATALGCAYAYANPKDCMILESSMLVGSEFSAVFRCYPININSKLSTSGREFLDELLRRNLINEEGRISIIPISGMLSERIIQKNIPLQLMARVEVIEKTEDGYSIVYFGMDGYSRISCKYIIDTTQTGACRKLNEKFEYKKSLSAMLSTDEQANADKIYEIANDRVSVIRGRFETEQVFRVYADKNAGYQCVREHMMSEWDKISKKELNGWRIAAIAAFFDYEYEKPINIEADDNYRWIPSASYNNVLDAFEAGTLLE